MRTITFYTLKIILVLISLTGCEYHHESILQNKTGYDIDLIIHFNKNTFEEAWRGSPYIPFLQQYGVDTGVTLIKFDSINLISHYRIQNNKSFVIDQGVGGRKQKPTYQQFNIFKVFYKRDSVIIVNENDFNKHFISLDYSDYIWTLK